MMKYFTLKNLGWLLTGICSFMLIMSGISKITGSEQMVQIFTVFNMMPYLTMAGIGEVVGVLLLLHPRTSAYGALVISSIMSGATVMHLSYLNGDGLFMPVMLGLLAWSGHCLRTYNFSK
jgi:uncharacterized membrane protein YphA (DoxX/SURF4 family)